MLKMRQKIASPCHSACRPGEDWNLLWRENEYLWQPIITPAVPSNWVKTVGVTDVVNGSIASANNAYSVYGSGGYCGDGGVITYDQYNSGYWPCAYGTPTSLGEREISMAVTISPTNTNKTVLNSEATLNLVKTAEPSAQQKRIGVEDVESIIWETIDGDTNAIQLGDNPMANGGEKRCFPERDAPEGNLNNELYAKVSLAAPIPEGMEGTVFLRRFDPDNPLEIDNTDPENDDEKRPDDNNGTGGFVSVGSGGTESIVPAGMLTFNEEESEKTVLFRFSPAHAGDNFVVAAHPNNGITNKYVFETLAQQTATGVGTAGRTLLYPKSGGTFSSQYEALPGNLQNAAMLTVWRTLWVELDQMAAPQEGATDGFLTANKGNANGQWNDAVPTSEPYDFDLRFQPPKPDISLLKTAMVDACVKVEEVLQISTKSSWITNDSASQNPNAWDTTTPFVHNRSDASSEGQRISATCRDVNALSETFWVLHAIGAYEAMSDRDPTNNTPPVGGTRGGNSGNGVFMIYNETIRDFVATCGVTTITEAEGRKGTALHEALHSFDVTHADGGVMDSKYYRVSENITWQTLLPIHIQKIQKTDVPN